MDVVLIGWGINCKIVIDILSQNYNIIGIYDDDITKTEILGFPIIGKISANIFKSKNMICTIGNNDSIKSPKLQNFQSKIEQK